MQLKKCKSGYCKETKSIDEFSENCDFCKTCEDERRIKREYKFAMKKVKKDSYFAKYKD